MMMMILVSNELRLMMMNLLYSKYRMHLQLAIRPCWIESHISYSMLHYTNYSAIRVAGITWQMKLSIHSSVEYEFFFSNETFSFCSIAGGQLPRTHICIFERNLAEPEWYGFTPAINRIVDTRCMVIGKFSIGLEYLVIDSHCTLMLLICSCTS